MTCLLLGTFEKTNWLFGHIYGIIGWDLLPLPGLGLEPGCSPQKAHLAAFKR